MHYSQESMSSSGSSTPQDKKDKFEFADESDNKMEKEILAEDSVSSESLSEQLQH